ncbi:MAG: DPP IV N-terminal domain-containing protein [Bacteroidales bacterium]|nr:DPP IV N-terminal domain-containing protein [Candidatus Physcousia equi]
MKIKKIILFVAMAVCTNVMAQKSFTLDDLMWGGSNAHNFRAANIYTTWWGNTPLETTPDEVKNLTTGKSLVSVKQINTWVGEDVVSSGHNLAFPYADHPIVQMARSNRWVQVNFQTGETVFDKTLPKGAAHCDFNVQSKNMAFTLQGNLYVMDAQGQQLQVSTDGSTDGTSNIVYGQSVHRDEFGISKGTFWSPDGQQLAFYRMDQSMVPSYPQVDITTRIATATIDHYPMAGERSHQVRVGIFHVTTQKTVWVEIEGAADDYHTNLSWAPDGKTLYIFELNRAQNDMRLVAYSTETGKRLRTVLRETDEKYVEPMNGLEFLPWDTTKAVMQSQRDGYNHLYLLDLRTDQLTQITKGKWVVQAFVGFCPKNKSIIYCSNESDPRQSCLYSISVKGGKPTLIGEQDGVHGASLSADGQQIIDRYTSPTVPRSVNLLNTKTGKGKNILLAADPWQEKGYNTPEVTSGSIKANDGTTDLYYRMVKPIGFDPNKKYPTIIYVYGGPHAHNVDASWHWSMRPWEAYMAQKGFLLFVLDNRGSEWRGKDFEQATYRHLGDVEMEDQMMGVAYLKSLPYVDADRMGVHGWSFGGFMTTNLMCSHPETFKVGVAGGPVIDWKYYEVMYGERYMSTPQLNPEGYAGSSLLNKAKNLRGRLQLITGYNDPTCVQQHTLSFLKACIDAGTQPDFFTYPGGGHNMYGNEQVHLHERITRYFEDYLK